MCTKYKIQSKSKLNPLFNIHCSWFMLHIKTDGWRSLELKLKLKCMLQVEELRIKWTYETFSINTNVMAFFRALSSVRDFPPVSVVESFSAGHTIQLALVGRFCIWNPPLHQISKFIIHFHHDIFAIIYSSRMLEFIIQRHGPQ